MKKLLKDFTSKRLTKKVGMPPGSLIYHGDKSKTETSFRFFQYNKDEFLQTDVTSLSQLNFTDDSRNVNWLEISGFVDTGMIQQIGDKFNIHFMFLEDIVNADHQPKFEETENHALLVLKLFIQNPDTKKIESLHVGLVLGKNYVLNFQENEHKVFDQKIDRIKQAKGRARGKHSDYLFYVLADAIIDNYYVVLEDFREKLSNLEDKILENTTENLIGEIYAVKKELSDLRRMLFPLKEAIANLIESESDLFEEETFVFFNDLLDHTKQIMEIYNSFSDTISSLVDLNNSNLSNNMNAVMKMLTLIATIFIPLTFIAGIYGMNFSNMPELQWEYGYFVTIAVMIFIGLTMYFYMKWKKWI